MLQKQLKEQQLSYKKSTPDTQQRLSDIENLALRINECDEFQNQIGRLRQRLEIVQQEYKNINCDRNEKSEYCESLNREVETAQQEIDCLQEKYGNWEISYLTQEEDLDNIKIEYETLENKYNQLKVSYDELDNCLTLQDENENLQKGIQKFKKHIKKIQQQLLEDQKFQQDFEDSTYKLERRNSFEDSNEKRIDCLRVQLKEWKEKYDRLQKEYDELSTTLMDNIQENDTLNNSCKAFQTKLEDLEQKCLQSKVNHLELISSNQNDERLQIVINDLEQELREEKQRNFVIQEFSQKDIKELRKEIKSLTADLFGKSKQIEELMKEKMESTLLNEEEEEEREKMMTSSSRYIGLPHSKILNKENFINDSEHVKGFCDFEENFTLARTSEDFLEVQKIQEERCQIITACNEKITMLSLMIDEKKEINSDLRGALEEKTTLIAEKDSQIENLKIEVQKLVDERNGLLYEKEEKFKEFRIHIEEKDMKMINDEKNFHTEKSTELETLKESMQEASYKIIKLTTENTQLNINLKNFKKEKKFLKQNLKEAKEETTKLQKKVKSVDDLMRKLNIKQNKMKTLKFQFIENEGKRKQEVKSLKKELVNERELLKEKIETLNLKLEDLTQQLDQRKSDSTNYDKILLDCKSLRKQLKFVGNEKSQLNAEVIRLKTKLAELGNNTNDVDNSNKDLENFKLELNELKTKLKSVTKQGEEYRTESKKLKDELLAEHSAIKHRNSEIQGQLGELKLKYQSLKTVNRKLETKHKEFEQRLKEEKREAAEMMKLQKQVKELQAEKLCLQDDLEKISEEMDNRKEQLQRSENSSESLKDALDTKIKVMTEERKKFEGTISCLQTENKRLSDRLEEIITEIDPSLSPSRRSPIKSSVNFSADEKLSVMQKDRKNRRSTKHDENRRQLSQFEPWAQ